MEFLHKANQRQIPLDVQLNVTEFFSQPKSMLDDPNDPNDEDDEEDHSEMMDEIKDEVEGNKIYVDK